MFSIQYYLSVVFILVVLIVGNVYTTPAPLYIFDTNNINISQINPLNGVVTSYYDQHQKVGRQYNNVLFFNSTDIIVSGSIDLEDTPFTIDHINTKYNTINSITFNYEYYNQESLRQAQFDPIRNLIYCQNGSNIYSYNPFTYEQTSDLNIQLPGVAYTALVSGTVEISVDYTTNLFYMYTYVPGEVLDIDKIKNEESLSYPCSWVVGCNYIFTFDLETSKMVNSINLGFGFTPILLGGVVSSTSILSVQAKIGPTDQKIISLDPTNGDVKQLGVVPQQNFAITSAYDSINQLFYSMYSADAKLTLATYNAVNGKVSTIRPSNRLGRTNHLYYSSGSNNNTNNTSYQLYNLLNVNRDVSLAASRNDVNHQKPQIRITNNRNELKLPKSIINSNSSNSTNLHLEDETVEQDETTLVYDEYSENVVRKKTKTIKRVKSTLEPPVVSKTSKMSESSLKSNSKKMELKQEREFENEEDEEEEVEDDEDDVDEVLDKSSANVEKETPAMAQYNFFKNQYPNSILAFKIGDFYEMFGDDAIVVSKLLNITLTSRKSKGIKDTTTNKSKLMCGFPGHAAETHIGKLIQFGKTVAICDQVNEPGATKNKLMKRQVTRVVTPGTVFEDTFLPNQKQNNYLASFIPIDFKFGNGHFQQQQFQSQQKFGISWMDLSTGQFFISETSFENLSGELSRISPSEIILPQSLAEHDQMARIIKPYNISIENEDHFNIENTIDRFKESFQQLEIKDLFSQFQNYELNVAGSILNYVYSTQIGKVPHLYLPQKYSNSSSMYLDYSTMNSLEITKTFSGQRKGSLLDTIDKTITPAGGRLLFSRIQAPILQITEINERLNIVEFFFKNQEITKSIRKLLAKTMDMERCLQRVYISRAGPRDLSGIGVTLSIATHIKSMMMDHLSGLKNVDAALVQLMDKISDFDQILETLSEALVDNPPISTVDGGFIQSGYSEKLDNYIQLRDNSKSLVQGILTKYKQKLALPQLKIKHNQIIGYFFEIPSTFREKIPSDFIHVQTLMNTMRFKSKDLIELEEQINRAASQALAVETEIFQELCTQILSFGDRIKEASQCLAVLDVSSSFGLLSRERLYTRPILTSKPILNIVGGRHPTVELAQSMKSSGSFISNDCHIDEDKNSRMWLITGPNMGGKSTFLRQNAMIIILAQMGCFVPAESAEIGVTDAIFSRVGASDDLSNDRSTFMVEMVETASILKKATPQSFVIMDEVGRGTSTLDGISIAQSVIEHLYHDNRSRTLFATHYHELTKLAKEMTKIQLHASAIKEEQDNILFTHKILPGVSNKSYGIFCAKLAGLPDKVIERSQTILSNLESKK
eukprot:gene2786-3461_t